MSGSLLRNPLIRFLVLAAIYLLVLAASLALSLLLRFDFSVPPAYWRDLAASAAWMLPLKLVLLCVMGQFRSLLTFFSLPDATKLALAMVIAATVSLLCWFVLQGQGVVPRGVILIDLVLSFAAMTSLRIAMRIYRERSTAGSSPPSGRKKRMLVIGAGKAGAALCQEIQSRPGLGAEVIAFVDDDSSKIGSTLHTKPVMGPLAGLPEIITRLGIDKIVIAMPSAAPSVIKSLVQTANNRGLDHDILPSIAQMLDRRVTVSHLRHVEPEDLLGRPPAKLDEEGIGKLLGGTVVMVTGAGGSIGAELCRQIAAKRPSSILLVERSEPALFGIHEELRQTFPGVELHPLATDAGHAERMEDIFRRHRPSLVFHAAAHKHVPLMEQQPAEAFLNNVVATDLVARLAGEHGAGRFILISTDKAVNPAGVMGATKRIAEMVIAERQRESRNCVYAAVRFGNVLGSSGSVVPIFRRQIALGGPVTVTHPEATRYFMSIAEAAGLILQSAWQARGGETFLLEMGEPLNISELARHMIELSGLVPHREIEVLYTGLRPGEKLTEETRHDHEHLQPTVHPKVNSILNAPHTENMRAALIDLHRDMNRLTPAEFRERLRMIASGSPKRPGFSPPLGEA